MDYREGEERKLTVKKQSKLECFTFFIFCGYNNISSSTLLICDYISLLILSLLSENDSKYLHVMENLGLVSS